MKRTLVILTTAPLFGLMSLQAYGQGHSALRTNRGGQLRGDARADEVHQLNAEKKGKKAKKHHKFALHHNDKDKGNGKGDNKQG